MRDLKEPRYASAVVPSDFDQKNKVGMLLWTLILYAFFVAGVVVEIIKVTAYPLKLFPKGRKQTSPQNVSSNNYVHRPIEIHLE